jgi:DNA-binding transcriptional MerR regulator
MGVPVSASFDLRKRIYDLYSFDAPYDLEPKGFSGFPQDYKKDLNSHKNSARIAPEDEEEFSGLDLTFEEDEPDPHLPTSGFRLSPQQDRTGAERSKSSSMLGVTLSQRKELLKERIEELVSDLHKREKLEEQMLEKADVETGCLEFLLGQVRSWSLGSYPSVDMRRGNLEREILTLKKAGWDEQLRCWRDLVALKKELREALEEYYLILSAEGL